MENENVQAENETDNNQRDSVNIHRGGAQNVNADYVTIRQGGAQSVKADHLEVRQGGVMRATTEQFEVLQGGVGVVQTKSAHLTASQSGVIVAGSDVQMEQSGTRVLVAGGDVSLDQGMSVLTISPRVNMQDSAAVFLLAKNVEGNVRPMFGPRESLLFGAVAGMVAGTIIMLGNLFRRKRHG